MSNIYIQEPPTSGKVLIKTSVGDIDIELWAKECPKTCRNFLQLCMESYYNNTIFHRVVKGFIVQGGDPSGDGSGGESIYGHPFKDEFHSRLRYVRRGLVGMANSGRDDNGSQFFFTMGPTPELQNKNTLFGKVTGDTIFNMLKLEDLEIDHNERPMYPPKILRITILNNPFEDIVPRILKRDDKKEKKKPTKKGVKNFCLLSFGVEAEEDEEETKQYVQKNIGKAKSVHDATNDPLLSKTPIKIESSKSSSSNIDELNAQDSGDDDITIKKEEEEGEVDHKQNAVECLKIIRDKLLTTKSTVTKSTIDAETSVKKEVDSNSDDDVLMTQEKAKQVKNERKKKEIQQEILTLKKQYQSDKRVREKLTEKVDENSKDDVKTMRTTDNELISNFMEEKAKYSTLKSQVPKETGNREDFTLNLLSRFRSKLDSVKQKQNELNVESTITGASDSVVEKEIQGDDWLAHTLKFEEKGPVVAKDASTKGDDWYDVYDPRHPLNKRKREGKWSTLDASSGSKQRKNN